MIALRFMLLSLALVVTPARSADYNFADIPWGMTITETTQLLDAKGFKTTGLDKDGDLAFDGQLIGHKMIGFGVFSEGKLAKIVVVLMPATHQARAVYRDIRETLIQKYGQPRSTYETFRRPYYAGDGYEDSANSTGQGDIRNVLERWR